MKEKRKVLLIKENRFWEIVRNPNDSSVRKGHLFAFTKDNMVMALHKSDMQFAHRTFPDFVKAATWVVKMNLLVRDEKLQAADRITK